MRSAAAALALGLLLIASGCGTSSAATQTSSGTDAASSRSGERSCLCERRRESRLAAVAGSHRRLRAPAEQARLQERHPPGARRPREPRGARHRQRQARGGCARAADGRGQAERAREEVRPGKRALHRRADRRLVGRRGFRGGVPVRAQRRLGELACDTANFKSAMSQVGDTGFATRVCGGLRCAATPGEVASACTGRRLAALDRSERITADKTALHIKARAAGGTSPAAYRPSLLHDVPSGAILAVSFKDVNQLLARVQSEPLLRTSLPPFVTSLRSVGGEGVLTSCRAPPIPVVTLEVHPSDPVAAATALRGSPRRPGTCCPCMSNGMGRSFSSPTPLPARVPAVGRSRRSVVQGCARRSRCPRQGHMAGVRRHPTARTDPASTSLADRERTGEARDDRQARQVPDARRIRRPLRLHEQRRGQAHLPLKLAGRSV